jgi:hypothetical protein
LKSPTRRDALKKINESGDLASYQRLWVMHDNNRVYGHMSAEGNRLIANTVVQQLFTNEVDGAKPH